MRLHAEKQRAHQTRLFDLTKVLTDAQNRLSRADSLKSYATERLQEPADAPSGVRLPATLTPHHNY